MKNPMEVLRQKEQDLERVKQEVEALRIVARLLGEEPYSAGMDDFRKVVEMP
jgi:hypothetical protein